MKQFKEVLREVECELVKEGEEYSSLYRLHLSIKRAINKKFEELGYKLDCNDESERSNTFFITTRNHDKVCIYKFTIKYTRLPKASVWDSTNYKFEKFNKFNLNEASDDIETFIADDNEINYNREIQRARVYNSKKEEMIKFLKKNIVSEKEYGELTNLFNYTNLSTYNVETNRVLRNMTLMEFVKVRELFKYSTLGGYHRNGFTYNELVKANNEKEEN